MYAYIYICCSIYICVLTATRFAIPDGICVYVTSMRPCVIVYGVSKRKREKERERERMWYHDPEIAKALEEIAKTECIERAEESSWSAGSVYVYHLSTIRERIRDLKAHLLGVPKGQNSAFENSGPLSRIFYAIKANANPDVLKIVHEEGLSFECVSLAEIDLLHSLFPSLSLTTPRESNPMSSNISHVLYTPNFAPRREIIATLKRYPGVLVTVDNMWALKGWGSEGVFRGVKGVFLRVDPGEALALGHHDKVRTAGITSKFGIPLSDFHSFSVSSFQSLLQTSECTVVGLHAHMGSGILEDVDAWRKTGRILHTLAHTYFPNTVRYINLGGGLGVPYKRSQGQPPLSLKGVADSLNTLRREIAEERGGDDKGVEGDTPLELWMEPGRYIVAEGGVLLTYVTQLKVKSKGVDVTTTPSVTPSTTTEDSQAATKGVDPTSTPSVTPSYYYVGVAAGMNALIRPALYDAYHHIENLSATLRSNRGEREREGEREGEGETMVCDVVGPICETGDVLGKRRLLPADTREEDIILVADADGMSMLKPYNLRTAGKELTM